MKNKQETVATEETTENSKESIEVIQLENYISYELLEKKKKENPNAKFILPNGKEAVLNVKQK